MNGRIIPKRIHVRIEHVHPSRCKEEFLRRVKANDEFKHEAKLKGGECHLISSLSGVVVHSCCSCWEGALGGVVVPLLLS